MKITSYLFAFGLALSLPAQAGLYNSGTLAGMQIPDNNSTGTGGNLTYTFSGAEPVIDNVTLNFSLQGGYASDLSGYLRLGNQLDSPSYILTSLIQGQTLNANQATDYSISFTTSSFHDTFNGLNPNNPWTLFFADSGAGGNPTTVNSWSLEISAVPEPTNVALAIFGILMGVGAFVRTKFKTLSWSK